MRKLTSCSSCLRRIKDWRPSTERRYHLTPVLFSTLPLHSLLLHILVSHQHIPGLPSAAVLQLQSDHSGGSSAVPGCHHKTWGPSSVSEPNGWNVWCPDTWKNQTQPLSTGRALSWELGRLWDNSLHWNLWAPPVQNVLWKTHESTWQFWLRATSTAFVPGFKQQLKDWQNFLTIQSVLYQESAQENQ